MSTQSGSDVVAIGVTCIDHVSIVTRTADGWEECSPPLPQGGGLSATASVAVARLGGRVELWAIVGDDYHGEMVCRELAAAGVGIANIRRRSDMRTPSAFIEVDSRTGDRTIYYSPGRRQPLPESEVDFDVAQVRGAKALLVDNLFPRTDAAAARVVHESGGVVVADFFFVDGPNAEVVPHVDALIIPEESANSLVGGVDYPRAVRRLVELGPQMPAVTAGALGCWYHADGAIYHCPAFSVKVVDTTGCGDSFHGAYAYAMAQGWDVHTGFRFASAVAGLKATKLGGRSGLPTLAEVTAFIEARPDEARASRVRD